MNMDHICTYQYYDPRLRAYIDTWKSSESIRLFPELVNSATYNKADVEEFEEFSDFLYQLDFLRCFSLEELNTIQVDSKISSLLEDIFGYGSCPTIFDTQELDRFVRWVRGQPFEEDDNEDLGGEKEIIEEEKDSERDQFGNPRLKYMPIKSAMLMLFSYDTLFLVMQAFTMIKNRRKNQESVDGILDWLKGEVDLLVARTNSRSQPTREADQVGSYAESSA